MPDLVDRGPSLDQGSTFQLIYSQRKLNCYLLTEPELSQLGMLNVTVTILVAIGSGLIGIALDVTKDAFMSLNLTDSQIEISNLVQKTGFGLGALCWVLALVAFVYRNRKMTKIKEVAQVEREPNRDTAESQQH